MSSKDFLVDVLVTLVLTFVVSAIVTYLYSLIAHGAGVFEWGTSFRLGVIFAIVLPWSRWLAQRKSGG